MVKPWTSAVLQSIQTCLTPPIKVFQRAFPRMTDVDILENHWHVNKPRRCSRDVLRVDEKHFVADSPWGGENIEIIWVKNFSLCQDCVWKNQWMHLKKYLNFYVYINTSSWVQNCLLLRFEGKQTSFSAVEVIQKKYEFINKSFKVTIWHLAYSIGQLCNCNSHPFLILHICRCFGAAGPHTL